ncbi:MAG: UDP-N-acetylmuramate dehydrogenase [Deltaproteobacteria bacterium]|nr:UDP-N-acetylmuramate dehydrogenase [Deltaproteobacteria bacterium]MBW2448044.1 UDP-N-acetylmuramate dehydrogenase [Deltaproteobacteria bacterium]
MSRHTSLRVGGPVEALVTPADRPALAALLALCKRRGWPHLVAGSGFNLLVRDGGLDGVAIKLSAFRALERRAGPRVAAEAGVSHASLTGLCTKSGLAGLEFGAGIPGTIGGWVAMNAGIGPREVKDVVESVELQVPGEDAPRTLDAADLDFRYRELHGTAPGSVIVGAVFRVEQSTPEAVQAEVDALLAQRAGSQPLDAPSCGSVFKNPPGDFAGRLIETVGLKGTRVGGAEISPTHANFIVNRGGATAADVLGLIETARERVAREAGVELETEVRIVGRNEA